jgi:hypothetical protein
MSNVLGWSFGTRTALWLPLSREIIGKEKDGKKSE